MTKLPVFGVIGESYAFVWNMQKAFWLLCMPPVVILAILSGVAYALVVLFGDSNSAYFANPLHVDPQKGPENLGMTIFVWVVFLLIYAAVFIMYSVAWHRVYLQPSLSVSVREAYQWTWRQMRFLLTYIKIALMMIAIVLIPMTLSGLFGAIGSPAGAFFAFVSVPAFIGAFWVYARMSILLPAVAVDRPMTIKQAFELTQGNGWRLFWIVLLVTMPVSFVSQIIVFGMSSLAVGLDVATTLTATLLIGLVSVYFGFFGIAVLVSALSISYAKLYGPTDDAIAARFD